MTPLLTVDRAAELLTLSRRTIYALVASGALKAIRVNRIIRIEPAEIARFKTAHQIAVVPVVAQTVTPERHRPADWCENLPGAHIFSSGRAS